MPSEISMEYKEYLTINHKWYNVNYFVNESINSLLQEVIKVHNTVLYVR